MWKAAYISKTIRDVLVVVHVALERTKNVSWVRNVWLDTLSIYIYIYIIGCITTYNNTNDRCHVKVTEQWHVDALLLTDRCISESEYGLRHCNQCKNLSQMHQQREKHILNDCNESMILHNAIQQQHKCVCPLSWCHVTRHIGHNESEGKSRYYT